MKKKNEFLFIVSDQTHRARDTVRHRRPLRSDGAETLRRWPPKESIERVTLKALVLQPERIYGEPS